MKIFYTFLVISLAISVSLEQEGVIVPKSFLYWLLIMISIFPAVFSINRITEKIVRDSKWMLIFMVTTLLWGLYNEGSDYILSLLLICISWMYILGATLEIKINNIAKIYIVLVFLGVIIKIFTEINYYEIYPFVKNNDLSQGRVSFAGNIGFAGIFSLLVFMILMSVNEKTYICKMGIFLSLYFIVFSEVRTAWIGLVLYMFMKILINLVIDKGKNIVFMIVFLVTVFSILGVYITPYIIGNIDFDFFGVGLFTQGKTFLEAEEIAIQMYRPLLWIEQLNQFFSSQYLMGLGSAAINIDIFKGIDVGYGGDTVSYPTRLLAYYGIPAILFIYATNNALLKHIKNNDVLAICSWPVNYIVMLNWGSLFHPTDVVGVLYLLLIFRGSNVFINHKKSY